MKILGLLILTTSVSLFTMGCSKDSGPTSSRKICLSDEEFQGIRGGTSVLNEDPLTKKVVLLMFEKGEELGVCTGTPISSDVVLTAGHCVAEASKMVAVFHSSLACSSGFNIDRDSVEVVEKKLHRDYRMSSFSGSPKNDLALVKLKSAIPADYEISKIYNGTDTRTSDTVTLLGYGVTVYEGSDSGYLRTVTKSYRDDIVKHDDKVQISQRDSGVCSGDSGGPVFIDVNGEMQILGVNSYVTGGDRSELCAEFGYAVDVTKYQGWIFNTLYELR